MLPAESVCRIGLWGGGQALTWASCRVVPGAWLLQSASMLAGWRRNSNGAKLHFRRFCAVIRRLCQVVALLPFQVCGCFLGK